MADIVFRAKNISKSFFGIPVLKNINLDMNKGEVHAILGENGAGKSTLIKIIGGIYECDSGELFLEGKRVIFNKAADAINNGIITIHQELNMCAHLTVMEILFLAREYRKNLLFFILFIYIINLNLKLILNKKLLRKKYGFIYRNCRTSKCWKINAF